MILNGHIKQEQWLVPLFLEFLTGMTMKFLPPGVSVYQTMIVKPMESLATTMREQGYQSIAFHPGKPTSWRRDVVYPYLGFERFLTEEDMEDPQYIRDTFVSDESDYDTVIQLFEEKGDKPLFLFNVTIQNLIRRHLQPCSTQKQRGQIIDADSAIVFFGNIIIAVLGFFIYFLRWTVAI